MHHFSPRSNARVRAPGRLRRRRARGISLLEVQIAAVTGLLITSALLAFTRFNGIVWQGAMADGSAQTAAQSALQRLTPSIRAARSVVTAASSSTSLTVQLPAYSGGGSLIIPLQDGDRVTYYLSDTSGAPGVSGGSILWRAINGTPDSTWSLRGSAGRVVLSAGGLQFSYSPTTGAPETVTVSVTAAATTGTKTSTLTTSQEVALRNKDL